MIDYQILANSVDFYTSKGFQPVETPWIVNPTVEAITKPSNVSSIFVFKEFENNSFYKSCLVASGEQSFLQMYENNYLPKGQFQTITPCFRDENTIDHKHQNWFMKNELIKTDDVSNEVLYQIVKMAHEFFLINIPSIIIDETENGFDINALMPDGEVYELGSYGIRQTKFLKWIYGTGCAEPRLSKAIYHYNSLINK